MCLEDGMVAGEQIVPPEWIARVRVQDEELIEAFRSSTSGDPNAPGAFYHDKWWVHDGPRGIYAGLGMNGQSVFIHRPARVVIAKFSTFPDALDDSFFALQNAGLLALADHLS
jgi:hypothetical protein